MRLSPVSVLLGLPGLVYTAATQLPDGMPNPNVDQLLEIEFKAHGTLPDGISPTEISIDGMTTLQWIAFNELFEVAFFNELLANVTNNVPGYEIQFNRSFNIRALTAILAQEELHALSANTALKEAKVPPIKPCKYTFPVTNYNDAINFAITLTDLTLGTLQEAAQRFATGNDTNLVGILASIIGQKGKQAAWYRIQQGKLPSELPFLTTSDISFALSFLQTFTLPDDCSSLRKIQLQTYPLLNILNPPANRTQNISVAWRPNPIIKKPERLWMAYINQMNQPIVVPLRVVSMNEMVVAEALFPYGEHLMNGLTIAVVTMDKGPFPDVNSVAEKTVFGPGLIVID